MQDGNSIKLTKIIVYVSPTYIQHAILHTDSKTSQLADLCIGAFIMKKNNTLYNFFSKHEKIFQVWKKKFFPQAGDRKEWLVEGKLSVSDKS